MSRSAFSLAWDSFKTNICNGFSALQQNGEFVDMTIAADGHFVKVHQVIIALASPYLKNLMASAPCQHPIIFLNNIPHKVLCYLLEYIYTGEVLVPSECFATFADAAKELHIKGLENITNTSDTHASRKTTIISAMDNTSLSQISGIKRRNAVDIDQLDMPPNARKVFIKPEGAHMSINASVDSGNDYSVELLDDSRAQHDDDDDDFKNEAIEGDSNRCFEDFDQVKANPSNLLYTMSIRGSLQVILNRYIYNLNSTTARKGVRRWRCVDYRNNKCNAYVVTKGNLVVNRSHLHNHPFHDKKILSKIEKKAVFSALDDVEAYRQKEKSRDDEDRLEDDNFDKDDKSG